ncbi:MAG: hypothetical protein QW279_16440 [Candidatus Jordarchaeaceae archaeon]
MDFELVSFKFSILKTNLRVKVVSASLNGFSGIAKGYSAELRESNENIHTSVGAKFAELYVASELWNHEPEAWSAKMEYSS